MKGSGRRKVLSGVCDRDNASTLPLCSRTSAGSVGKQLAALMDGWDRGRLSHQQTSPQKTHGGRGGRRREQGRGEAGSGGQKQRAQRNKKTGVRAAAVAQQLRTCTVLAEDLSLVPGTLVWPLTTACNSGSRGSYALFWPPGALRSCTHTHTYT